ncbi:hypothetical protein [Sorangium sp. So ce341]|uniref:hypothetical protein n=1 Tax=Sorangium sp. So ce341 TaxID=3133302 RepID=UPI003F60FCC1
MGGERDGGPGRTHGRYYLPGLLRFDGLSSFAADLAERGVGAVYPVSGWWKDQRDKGSALRACRHDRDARRRGRLWTAVTQQVGVPVEIAT